jgi:branched-chain amino acid transport system ATP-binding protein
MLEVSALSVGIGGRRVVDEVDLAVAPGEIVGVVGPNGAGKTSLGRALAGFLGPAAGTIRLTVGTRSLSLERKRVSERCRLGVVYVPSDRAVFAGLTTRENLALVEAALGSAPNRRDHLNGTIAVGSGIRLRAGQSAETLSGGEQRLLALARAELLVEIARNRGMASTGYLILDEPSRGLAPRAVDALVGKLGTYAKQGIGILILEQDAPLPLRVAHRVHRMELGRLGPAQVPESFE